MANNGGNESMNLIKGRSGAFIALCLLGGHAMAASTVGDTVYEKVDMFSNSLTFTDGFTIDAEGIYKATLTDFEFPRPLVSSSLSVDNGSASVGSVQGPGSFTFEAGLGDYSVNLAAQAASVSEEEKTAMVDTYQKENGAAWWKSLTDAEKQAEKALWNSWSTEEMMAHQEKIRNRAERRVEEQLAQTDSLGQYGILIDFVESTSAVPGTDGNTTVVPLPAAVWLFGSGLLGLLATGRGSARHSSRSNA